MFNVDELFADELFVSDELLRRYQPLHRPDKEDIRAQHDKYIHHLWHVHKARPENHFDKSYDIHPEYTLNKRKQRTPAYEMGGYNEHWHVNHTPTGLEVGSFTVNTPSPSVQYSQVESPFHKAVGRLAYARLVQHYGKLTSDKTGETSDEARRAWKSLGAKRRTQTMENHAVYKRDRSDSLEYAADELFDDGAAQPQRRLIGSAVREQNAPMVPKPMAMPWVKDVQQVPKHRTMFTKTPARWEQLAANPKSYLSIGHTTAKNSELWWHDKSTGRIVTGAAVNKRGKKRTHAGVFDVKNIPHSSFGRIDHAQKKISFVPNIDSPPGEMVKRFVKRRLQAMHPEYEVEEFAANAGVKKAPLNYMDIGHDTEYPEPGKPESQLWWHHEEKGMRFTKGVENQHDELVNYNHITHLGRIDHKQKKISVSAQDDHPSPLLHRSIINQLKQRHPGYEIHEFASEAMLARYDRPIAVPFKRTAVKIAKKRVLKPGEYSAEELFAAELPDETGDKYFHPSAYANAKSPRSRSTLIHMHPRDFLHIAEAIPGGEEKHKSEGIEEAIKNKVKLHQIPSILFDHDGQGKAVVKGHEGRHRAIAMLRRGITKMPVELRSREGGAGQGIRWDSQNNKYDKFSRIKGAWPQTLHGEGLHAENSIPFPVKDLRKGAVGG